MALRQISHGRARGSTARSTKALLAVAVTASLTSQMAPAFAEESSDSGAEAYLADLVSRVTETQDEVTSLEIDLGGLRESVNKSRVDFNRRAQEAQEAQNKVVDARSRLGSSQSDLDTAQADLDEIARATYTQGGDASAITLASGSSASDAIDRATYIRLAAERQQAEVDRLDLARTQAANEESQLRENRNTADGLVSAARDAQTQAQQRFEQVQQRLSEKTSSHTELLAEAEAAKKQLAAAREAVDRVVAKNANASSFDKRRAAEAAVEKVETAPADTSATAEAESTTPASTIDTTGDLPVDGGENNADSDDTATTEGLTETTEDTTSADFSADPVGDSRRQAAIDGLVNAAGAAFVAGANAAASGGDPMDAAAQAGQSSAAQSYGNLPSADANASGTTGSGSGESFIPNLSGTAAQQIESVIARGMTQMGVTYSWGGGNWYGPTLGIRDGGVADSYGDYAKVGFDCSGLMMYSFYAVGIQLEHYSGYQYTAGLQVPVEQAQRGDMLFWGSGGSNHVALYLGDGKMLEAPQSGSVVQISDVRWSGIEPMATRMIQ